MPGVRTPGWARQVGPGPAGMSPGRRGLQPGRGRGDGAAPQRRDSARGPRPRHLCGSAPLEPGLARGIVSLDPPLPHSLPRGVPAPRAPELSRAPRRQYPQGPDLVRTSRGLPSALEVGPPEGAPGGRPPAPGQGLRRQGLGDRGRRAPLGRWGAGACWNLRRILSRQLVSDQRGKRGRRLALPVVEGAGALKAELRSLDHKAGAATESLKHRRGRVQFLMGMCLEVAAALELERRECGR